MSAPFAMGRFGGLLRTATQHAAACFTVTIAPEKAAAHPHCLLDPETRSFYETRKEQRSLFGECPDIAGMGSRGSSAPSSETRVRTSHQSLSDRLTPSLILSGLICGITPLSIRGQLGQPIRVLALDAPVGGDADLPNLDYLSLRDDAALQPKEGNP